jgi:hypothetical protein
MLRRILMVLSVLVALIPYLGIPRAIDAYIYSSIGMVMFLLLLFTKRSRKKQGTQGQRTPIVSTEGQPVTPRHIAETEVARPLAVAHEHTETHPSIDITPRASVEKEDTAHPEQPHPMEHAPTRRRSRKASLEHPATSA